MPDLAQIGPGLYLLIFVFTPCICLQTPPGFAPFKGAGLPLPEKVASGEVEDNEGRWSGGGCEREEKAKKLWQMTFHLRPFPLFLPRAWNTRPPSPPLLGTLGTDEG